MHIPSAQSPNNSTFTPSLPVQPSWNSNIYSVWTIRVFLFFGTPFLLHKIYQLCQTRRTPDRDRYAGRGRAISILRTATGLVQSLTGNIYNLNVDFESTSTPTDNSANDLAITLNAPGNGFDLPHTPADTIQRPPLTYNPPPHNPPPPDLDRGLDVV